MPIVIPLGRVNVITIPLAQGTPLMGVRHTSRSCIPVPSRKDRGVEWRQMSFDDIQVLDRNIKTRRIPMVGQDPGGPRIPVYSIWFGRLNRSCRLQRPLRSRHTYALDGVISAIFVRGNRLRTNGYDETAIARNRRKPTHWRSQRGVWPVRGVGQRHPRPAFGRQGDVSGNQRTCARRFTTVACTVATCTT